MEAPVGALFLFRPDLVEGVAVVENTVFHDIADLAAVVDVFEGVLVKDDEIGDFADFDGTEVFLDAEGFGSHDCRRLEDFHIRETPHL